MHTAGFRNLVQHGLQGAILMLALALVGCASLVQREPVRINVVGLEPLPGQGMEMRFADKGALSLPDGLKSLR